MKQFACTIPKTAVKKDTAQPVQTFAPEKRIVVLDQFGTPLVGVHVISASSNIITDAKGEAVLSTNETGNISFSHIGKITQQIPFSALGNIVMLKDTVESLDEVVIKAVKDQKSNLWLWVLGLGSIGAYMMAKNSKKNKKPKPVTL